MKAIAKHYIEKIITAPEYFSDKPCRNVNLLYPPFYSLVKKVSEEIKKANSSEVVCVETYRSNTLQLRYFNQGASKIRNNGMHHYGIASDMAFLNGNSITYNGDYKLLRSIAKEKGIHLLGLWDAGHFQFISVEDQTELRAVVLDEVKKFQKANGLVVDGIVGKRTIAKAKELYL